MTDPITGELIDRAIAKEWIRGMLAQHFDELLAAEGFSRPPKGIAYIRKLAEGKQRLEFDFLVRPRYAKDSFQLGLYTSVLFPAVAAKAAELYGRPPYPGPPRDLVERELLGTLVRNPPMMKFRSPADLDRYARWIQAYLDERVLPYLRARRTVRDFAEYNAQRILRYEGIATRGRTPVVIAAALLVLGEPGRAGEILEAAYPKDSPERPQYEYVFDAITP